MAEAKTPWAKRHGLQSTGLPIYLQEIFDKTVLTNGETRVMGEIKVPWVTLGNKQGHFFPGVFIFVHCPSATSSVILALLPGEWAREQDWNVTRRPPIPSSGWYNVAQHGEMGTCEGSRLEGHQGLIPDVQNKEILDTWDTAWACWWWGPRGRRMLPGSYYQSTMGYIWIQPSPVVAHIEMAITQSSISRPLTLPKPPRA